MAAPSRPFRACVTRFGLVVVAFTLRLVLAGPAGAANRKPQRNVRHMAACARLHGANGLRRAERIPQVGVAISVESRFDGGCACVLRHSAFRDPGDRSDGRGIVVPEGRARSSEKARHAGSPAPLLWHNSPPALFLLRGRKNDQPGLAKRTNRLATDHRAGAVVLARGLLQPKGPIEKAHRKG